VLHLWALTYFGDFNWSFQAEVCSLATTDLATLFSNLLCISNSLSLPFDFCTHISIGIGFPKIVQVQYCSYNKAFASSYTVCACVKQLFPSVCLSVHWSHALYRVKYSCYCVLHSHQQQLIIGNPNVLATMQQPSSVVPRIVHAGLNIHVIVFFTHTNSNWL